MGDPVSPSEALDWANRLWGLIVGVVGAIVGMTAWILPKFRAVNARVDTVEEVAHAENDKLAGEFHSRINTLEKLIVELSTMQKSHIETYKGLRYDLQKLGEKTDTQTAVLNQVVGELQSMRQRGNHE